MAQERLLDTVGYVSLNLPDPGEEGRLTKSRTLWRRWKQLSRFQRSLIYMTVLVITLGLAYTTLGTPRGGQVSPLLLPTTSSSQSPARIKLPLIEEPSKRNEGKFGGEKEELNVAEEEDKDASVADGKIEEGADSNDAGEEKAEVDDQLGLLQKSRRPVDLPPGDGSVKFGGPQNERQRGVVAAFQHAWQGYRAYAWGHDHLKPISKTHQTWFNLGLTLIDSLDTMLVMNLQDEFKEAKGWVENNLNFDINKDVNLFETTIRVLGGLLSTFHLTKERVFLDKAIDLAGETYSQLQHLPPLTTRQTALII